jgi:hypothetical protein
MGIVIHVIFFTQYCLCGISLYRQVMPPSQAMSIRDEEEDSSVGDWGGCDFRHLYLLLSLSRKLFISSGFRYSSLMDLRPQIIWVENSQCHWGSSCFLTAEEATYWLWLQVPWRRGCLCEPLRCHAVHQLWEATLWCMCCVESRVCFWCDRLGYLVKLCPSLAALTQSSYSVVQCRVWELRLDICRRRSRACCNYDRVSYFARSHQLVAAKVKYL